MLETNCCGRGDVGVDKWTDTDSVQGSKGVDSSAIVLASVVGSVPWVLVFLASIVVRGNNRKERSRRIHAQRGTEREREGAVREGAQSERERE